MRWLRYTSQVDAVAALGGEFSGMKLTCEQCGTQYSISDSKIVGADRVFKIRCKNCDAIMNIPGIVGDVSANSTADAEDTERQWFYGKDGLQVGPVSLRDFEEAVHSGTVASNTYVWTSGMADWKSAHEVPEIVERLQARADAAAGDGAETPPEEEPAVTTQEDPDPPAAATDLDVGEQAELQDDGESSEPAELQDDTAKTVADDSNFMAGMTQTATEQAPVASVVVDVELEAADTTIFTLPDTEEGTESSATDSLEAATDTPDAPPVEASEPSAEESDTPAEPDGPAASDADEASDPGPRRTSTIDAIGQPLEFEEVPMGSAESSGETEDTDAADARHFDDSGPEHTVEQPSPWADYNEREEEPKVDTGATLDALFMGNEEGETDNKEDADMVWERHENSVLFSLGNLDESPAPPSRRAKGTTPDPGAETDTTVESSLIDIGSFRKKKQSKNSRSDLFGVLTQDEQNARAETGSTPGFTMSPNSVVLPGVRRQRRAHFRIGMIAIAAAVLAGIFTAGAIWMFGDHDVAADGRKNTRTASTAIETAAVAGTETNTPSVESPTTPRGAETTDKSLVGSAETSNSDVKTTAPTEASPPGDKPDGAQEEPTVALTSESSVGNPEASPAAPVAKTEQPTTPPKPLTPKERRKAREKAKERAEKKREKREKQKTEKAARAAVAEERRTEQLRKKAATERKKTKKPKETKTGSDLNKQLNNLRKKQANTSTGLGGLPARLTAGQIRRVVRRAYGSVRGCARAAGLAGIRISVKFTINGSGSVGGVAVTGPAAGTSANGCVQGSIRRLRFPQFNGSQRVSFPFMIK